MKKRMLWVRGAGPPQLVAFLELPIPSGQLLLELLAPRVCGEGLGARSSAGSSSLLAR